MPTDTFIPPKKYSLGGDLTKVPKITDVPRLDLAVELSKETSNPFLRQLRVTAGMLKPLAAERVLALGPTIAAPALVAADLPAGTGAPASVDWRNRYGWNWLTDIKDQGGCESCWVFSAVGVVEAMTRIEHAIWSLRSEGDVHDGLGASCGQTGGPATAFNWMQANGAADPGCWAYQQQNLPYKPTSDRSGRTVRLDGYVTLNNIQDQKNWINQVGPLSACFTCYNDFFGYTSDVYKCNTASGVAGGHCIVIVGYDDAKQAWLVRNSWGTGWGMSGYCWFAYNQCDMDTNVKYGVNGASTNPDPWTKRRAHNGNLLESGDGTFHRNFEVWALAPGHAIRHYWRDGNTLQWAVAETQGNDCAACPAVTGTTYNRNFEMVYPTTGNRLHHRYFVQSSGTWQDGPIFGPTNVVGIPGFIQADYATVGQGESGIGAPGDFEVVVMISTGQLQNWWRNEANNSWVQGQTFHTGVAHAGAGLVQRWDRGLDYVHANTDGTMQRCTRPPNSTSWTACEKFGANVKSAPVMIRSQFGAATESTPGNYELCVAVNGAIQHWWTAGEQAANWANSATFGSNVAAVHGLIESSFGFDLEVIALLNDGSLQHFWRDGAGWHAGPVFGSTTH